MSNLDKLNWLTVISSNKETWARHSFEFNLPTSKVDNFQKCYKNPILHVRDPQRLGCFNQFKADNYAIILCTMSFEVSVIIPVYKAEKYVTNMSGVKPKL